MRLFEPFLILSLAVIVLGMSFFSFPGLSSASPSVESSYTAPDRAAEAIDLDDSLTSSYTDADGVSHTICTHLKVGESTRVWVTRHKLAVKAMKQEFPPIK